MNFLFRSGKHMEKEVFDNALNEEAYMKGISNLRKYFQGGYQYLGSSTFFFTGSRFSDPAPFKYV